MVLFLLVVTPTMIFAKASIKPITFNGKIVFQRDTKDETQVFVMEGKTGKIKKLTHVDVNIDPKWSPDGKKIAFASTKTGQYEVYIMDSDGKNQKRITYTKGGFSREPRWSSDGEEIYFFSNIKGDVQENVITVATGKIKTLFGTGELNVGKAMEIRVEGVLGRFEGLFKIFPAPDKRYNIVYYEHRKDYSTVLINKVTKTKIILGKGGEPSWSKDGKKIAYFSYSNGTFSLVIYDVKKKQYKKIPIYKNENEFCESPSWSQNSNKIIYYCSPEAGPGECWLYMLDLKTEKSEKLTKGQEPDWY